MHKAEPWGARVRQTRFFSIFFTSVSGVCLFVGHDNDNDKANKEEALKSPVVAGGGAWRSLPIPKKMRVMTCAVTHASRCPAAHETNVMQVRG